MHRRWAARNAWPPAQPLLPAAAACLSPHACTLLPTPFSTPAAETCRWQHLRKRWRQPLRHWSCPKRQSSAAMHWHSSVPAGCCPRAVMYCLPRCRSWRLGRRQAGCLWCRIQRSEHGQQSCTASGAPWSARCGLACGMLLLALPLLPWPACCWPCRSSICSSRCLLHPAGTGSPATLLQLPPCAGVPQCSCAPRPALPADPSRHQGPPLHHALCQPLPGAILLGLPAHPAGPAGLRFG